MIKHVFTFTPLSFPKIEAFLYTFSSVPLAFLLFYSVFLFFRTIYCFLVLPFDAIDSAASKSSRATLDLSFGHSK